MQTLTKSRRPGLFHLPVLSAWDFGLFRSPGPGLGNLLFPIARALAGAERTGGVFVQPTMRQIKLGPILRNEPDKRIYGDVIVHRSAADMALRCMAALNRHVSEDEAMNLDSLGKVTVTYAGLHNYFHDFAAHQLLISRWISKKARLAGAVHNDFDIAVHVRLGDFAKAGAASTGHSIRQSAQWYHAALDAARNQLGGSNHRIVVFTDAPAEIAELTADWGASLDPGRNALTSMLNMARARTIVASRSTFSMWAAFLGNRTAIWDEGFDLAPYWPARPQLDRQFAMSSGKLA